MNFFFSFLILFVIIITNKLFLFNEEFLILLSFSGFCFVTYEKLAPDVNLYFSKKLVSIEDSLKSSLELVSLKLIQKKSLNSKLVGLQTTFTMLKRHYLNFSADFLYNYLFYLKNKEKSNLLTNLEAFSRIEKDYSKFIFLLVTKKINTISIMTMFYSSKLLIRQFKLINHISRLSSIKKI